MIRPMFFHRYRPLGAADGGEMRGREEEGELQFLQYLASLCFAPASVYKVGDFVSL